MHPCLAVAFCRWEAFKFDANDFAVPAIRFAFFASRLGGYYDFPSLTDRDYQFIVQLPDAGGARGPWPIGDTPDAAMNTVVLQGYPLRRFDSAPFKDWAATDTGIVAGAEDAPPLIELVAPDKSGDPPVQAKVTIPLTQLKAKKVDAYGVIVSLGWSDPSHEQARRAKKCSVTFQGVEMKSNKHPTQKWHPIPSRKADEWIIKIGVNGRWFCHRWTDMKPGKYYPLDKTFTFTLGEGDEIGISAHGAVIIDPGAGRYMNTTTYADRLLRFSDDEIADYQRDAVCSNNAISKRMVADYDLDTNEWKLIHPILWGEVWFELVNKLRETWGNENDRLGLLDPGLSATHQSFVNPVPVSGWDRALNNQPRRLRAFLTRAEGDFEGDPNTPEYELICQISLDPQF